MAANLGTLTLNLIAKVGGFTGPLDKAGRHAKKTSNSMVADLKRMGPAIAVGLAAATAAVAVFIKSTIDAADNARKTAQGIGLTTEAFQGLTFAAKIGGVDQEVFAKAIGKLNKAMFDAANNLKTYKDAFMALELEYENADGLRSTEEVLYDLADIMAKNETGSEKTAVAMSLLGTRIGGALVPFLNQGSEGIKEFMAQAEALGFIMSDKAAQGAEQFNDSLTVLAAVGRGFWNQVTAELLPAMNYLVMELIDVTSEGSAASVIAHGLATAMKWLAKTGIGVVTAFDLAGTAIAGVATITQKTLKTFEGVTWKDWATGPFRKIINNMDGVKEATGIVRDEFIDTMEKYNKLLLAIDAPADAPGMEEINNQIKESAAFLKALRMEQEEEAKAKQLIDSIEDLPAFRGGNSTFGEFENLATQQEQLEEWYASQQELLEEFRAKKIDIGMAYDEKEERLAQQHADALKKIEQARMQLMFSTAASAFGEMAEAIGEFAGEESEAYKTMFAASKAFAIAEASINMYKAISDAWATGATIYDKIAAVAVVTSSMAAIISSITSIGMAHEGIDTVPKSGSWLLEKGERVVTGRTSKKLDDTLSRINEQGGGGTVVNVYAPAGSDVQQESSMDNGTETIDIYIDRAVSGKINNPGSRTYKSLKNTFGLGRQLTKR